MRTLSAAVLALALGVPAAQSASAAASIVGSWSGRGSVTLNDGQVEPVSCNLRYEESTGRTFVLNARCATTAGTFVQSGRVVQRTANSYTGRLYSDQYAVTGEVVVSVSGSRQTVRVSSPKGNGSITLNKR